MTIAIDFDGTCVTHDFPYIGAEIGAPAVLKKLTEQGHKLILFTMRSDMETVDASGQESIHSEPGDYLTQAIKWFQKHDIPLYGVQTNPTQAQWTASPKAYAELYIDDAALGAPLKKQHPLRPYIDWERTEQMLVELNILK